MDSIMVLALSTFRGSFVLDPTMKSVLKNTLLMKQKGLQKFPTTEHDGRGTKSKPHLSYKKVFFSFCFLGFFMCARACEGVGAYCITFAGLKLDAPASAFQR